ncbi:hypothetical protein ZIOFF_014779 [Zingiber officinale]|uniref:Macrophage erythroblast attacher n=1 Tax=Zingiber officinale TaxID=94328 RepID=A0A8J5LPR5_ZINOF|nr:hypothetical protein ZIOFF_014779 [Zingiber officinale]
MKLFFDGKRKSGTQNLGSFLAHQCVAFGEKKASSQGGQARERRTWGRLLLGSPYEADGGPRQTGVRTLQSGDPNGIAAYVRARPMEEAARPGAPYPLARALRPPFLASASRSPPMVSRCLFRRGIDGYPCDQALRSSASRFPCLDDDHHYLSISPAMDMAVDMAIDAAPNGDASAAAPAVAAAHTSTARLAQIAESLKLEHQLVRVPLEHLKKTIRSNYRLAEREFTAVLNSVAEASGSSDSRSMDETLTRLSSLVTRLQGLKRKLEEGGKVENVQVQRCRARLEHLGSVADADKLDDWKDARLNRILVDYLLRMSYYDSAKNLAETADIQELADIDVFFEAKRVIESLRNKDLAPALVWCAENKPRLKKSKSKLEFQLRLQEFIELVRANEHMKAIFYARRYLAPWAATNMKEMQRVVTTLAFRHNTECSIYKVCQKFSSPHKDHSLDKVTASGIEVDFVEFLLGDSSVLFEPTQWDYLVEQFKQEFCRLFGMTNEPLLNIYLQAGLTALKTPLCYKEACSKEDPLSQEGFRKLAEPLPFSKLHHSKLVCYISKKPMDHENPPLVLPNGHVYSTKALEEMSRQNDGRITCPRTGEVCNFTELVKAFIS